MSCEQRFHRESFGWEAQFFERAIYVTHMRIVTKAATIRWLRSRAQAPSGFDSQPGRPIRFFGAPSRRKDDTADDGQKNG
jgi:hypothetical protein